MIGEQWRYFSPEGSITPGGPSKWQILDWDQRRLINVVMDEEQDDETLAIELLKTHIDDLQADTITVHLGPDGKLLSSSADRQDDETKCPWYPAVDDVRPPERTRTVVRTELQELDRLAPNVDLVACTANEQEVRRKLVFKYYFLKQFLPRFWSELNISLRLPPHPNIVPFDRIVLDELQGRVIGFTTVYIPGGTLGDNTSRIFRLRWLEQLLHSVDELNFKYGIMHQDIAARNLLVDPQTDTLMLFDFNYSARIGHVGYLPDRSDVKGVIFTLYEIITGDEHYRKVPHDQQDTHSVEQLAEWKQHPNTRLDGPVPEYRSVLNRWVKQRREGKQIKHYTEASEHIDWPGLPQRSPGGWSERRREKQDRGEVILSWERPTQHHTPD